MIRKRPAKKAKNGYTYQVYFYYRDMFDKRKYYSKSGFLTKKEAQIHETEMKARLKEKGTLNQGTNKTFNDVFEEFMESEGKNLSLNTIRRKKVTFLTMYLTVLTVENVISSKLLKILCKKA